MKRKIIIGTTLATFLMVSLAFVQPITAHESGITEVIDAIDHISGIAYDEDFQLLVEQIFNDRELTAILEASLSAEDSAQLERLAQQFAEILERNPAYIELTRYIDRNYGADLAVLETFSEDATTEDVHTVINSVVSADGTDSVDNAPSDFSAAEEDSSSGFSAPEDEEITGWTPIIDPIGDDVIVVDDLYPVYAPWLGLPSGKDYSYDSINMDDLIMDAGEQTVYIWGSEGSDTLPGADTTGEETMYPVGEDPLPPADEDNTPYVIIHCDINMNPIDVYVPGLGTIPYDDWLALVDLFGDDDLQWMIDRIIDYLEAGIEALIWSVLVWLVLLGYPEEYFDSLIYLKAFLLSVFLSPTLFVYSLYQFLKAFGWTLKYIKAKLAELLGGPK